MTKAALAPTSTIDANISDLFFTRELDHCTITNSRGQYQGYDRPKLESEADLFLSSLSRLGVDVPSRDDLLADFFHRL
ncbi:hypothetical protein [Bradyrhizobium cenepequi]|uniref:hypothetical protein n=1 Tax=Bradyrhizobium cenepequi TaxID=2821403 RepID=UPI001CE39214|nr:hypothetical protein [Bradyrhizobium cenepequi]MCA6108137.1 hypothetical protein [Bradyrhizobium cenepequi]